MKKSFVFIPILVLVLTLAGRRAWGENQELLRLFESGETAGILKILEADPQQLKADLGEGMTPLHYAVYTGNETVFDYLIKHGLDLHAMEKRGLTPVWFTVSGGRPAMLKKLIALGADLGVKDAQGNTLLHRATHISSPDLIGILLDNLGPGLKIDEKNAHGLTPLMQAVSFNNSDAAQALVLRGADVNLADSDGLTPMRIAVEKGASELVDLLIARRADLGVVDEKTGKCLLHEAAVSGKSSIVGRLLAAGVPKNAKDKNGLTALSYACKYGNEAAADLLRKSDVEDVPWVTNFNDSPFLPQGRFLDEGRIFSIACHDVDGDGRADIIISDYLKPARILFNDAGLEFKKAVQLTSTKETATSGHGVAVSDFNGDGRPDLLFVFTDYPARMYFGDGRGRFKDSGQAIGAAHQNGTGVKVVDVDGDKDLDVFISYYQARGLLYLNDGTGVLTESDQVFSDLFQSGDLDGDGDIDVISEKEKQPCSFWLNEKGRFILQDRTIDFGEGSFQFSLVDLDADGDADVFAYGRTEDSLWWNEGRGTFRKSDQKFNPGRRMVSGDIDGDRKLDLVVGSSIWLNRGGGRFQNVQTIEALDRGFGLQLADIDGDGDLDLLGSSMSPPNPRGDLLLFMNVLRGK